ncbi:MAG: hypothetical protein IT444_00600 [Phycisphaeraceae bacterium]|nr:hypothetical protein [Phycisphaeraceae bacterium]
MSASADLRPDSTDAPPSAAVKVRQLRDLLDGVRAHASHVWWSTTILGTLGALVILLLLAVFLDQILGGLPAAIRTVLLLVVIAGPALVIWRALKTKPGGSPEELALLVEGRYPELNNVLINTLQLSQAETRYGAGIGSEELIASVADDAGAAIHSINPSQAIPKRMLAIAGLAAGIGGVIFLAYAAINGDALKSGLGRVFIPLGDNTLTHIREVTPGDADVLVNSQVDVTTRLEGRVPTQAQLVCVLSDGRKLTVPMLANPAVPDRLTGRLDRVEADTTYYVVAGDDKSDRFTLRAHQKPTVQQITQTITPPDYIEAAPTEVISGSIQALPGSKVSLRIQSNEPLKAGGIVLGDGKETPLVLEKVPGSNQSITGLGSITVTRGERYTVNLTSLYGFAGDPSSYDISVLEDKLPQVEIIKPTGELSVKIDDKVTVEVRANDDYGLKELRLVKLDPAASASSDTTTGSTKVLGTWTSATRKDTKATLTATVNVAELGLTEQIPILLQAVAIDQRPDAPLATSGILTIRLRPSGADDLIGGAKVARISLDALIAKQKANLAATVAAAQDSKPQTGTNERISPLVGRQEDIRKDALALVYGTTPPGESQAGGKSANTPAPLTQSDTQRKLSNLAETLMVVAIEQLRAAAGTGDPKAKLAAAIDSEKAILAALVIAQVRQDADLAERAQREIAELLAELIIKQSAIRSDTATEKESGKALSARQSALARDVSRLQKSVAAQGNSGAGGNPELASAYTAIAEALESKKVRGNMIISAERLDASTTPEAAVASAARNESIKKQDQVIADLKAIQQLLKGPALAEAKEESKDAIAGLKGAKEKVDKLTDIQQKITEVSKQLQKTQDLSEGKEMDAQDLKDLAEARKALEDVMEQLIKDMHLLPDMSASNDLLEELSEVFEKVKQEAGSENQQVSEVAVDRDEATLAALRAMQKKMGERIGDLEMWLAKAPDSTKWNLESYDKNELGKIPLGDLQDQLEDIIGDLLDQQEELSQKAEDSVSNVALPDPLVGWDIADGPMPSWAAKGKSGNDKPNSNEQTGRSGSGRQGKSSGEIVGDTVKNLKGADVEARRTNDGFQAGELKEEEGGEKMDVKATGGGKLAGTSDTEGMSGDAPPRDELRYRDMARQQMQVKRDAETVYSKAKLLKLPTGELDRAILEMDAAARRGKSGDIEGFAKAQQNVIRALRETQAKLSGRQIVEGVAGGQRNETTTTGATNEPVPKQYEDAVAEYMKKISE